ncbi:MAG: hypothetical protein ACKPKO_45805, partial [Candidatus Fonsibacter sp.]
MDFDNKEEENTKSGSELAALLNMDQYNAPKQYTPSGGLHYIFYADAKQASMLSSKTCITHEG